LNGKVLKNRLEAEKIQFSIEDHIIWFLNTHLEKGYLHESTTNIRNWLNEIYPEIGDETEQDEELISAFVAGMVCTLINTPGTGIKFIWNVPPPGTTEDYTNQDTEELERRFERCLKLIEIELPKH